MTHNEKDYCDECELLKQELAAKEAHILELREALEIIADAKYFASKTIRLCAKRALATEPKEK